MRPDRVRTTFLRRVSYRGRTPPKPRGRLEDLPSREPNSRGRNPGEGHKSGGYGPLLRWLDSHVGRPWLKVYAELTAKRTGASSYEQRWLLSACQIYYVRENIRLIDGVPHEPYYDRTWRPLLDVRRYRTFYVHPETGLLCRSPRKLRKRRPLPEYEAPARREPEPEPAPDPHDWVRYYHATERERIYGRWLCKRCGTQVIAFPSALRYRTPWSMREGFYERERPPCLTHPSYFRRAAL